MNSVIVSGTVIAAPEQQVRSAERVVSFRIAIDVRNVGKRPTEATCCCWRAVGTFAQDLAVGDRVVVAGSLGHMAGAGLVISVLQLARLGEEVSSAIEHRESEEITERNWSHYLGLPPEYRR